MFGVAKPLDKDDFLRSYKDISLLSQLILAPLGAPSQILSLIGPEASDGYAVQLRAWEEIVSRAVYHVQSIPEDRVAASMHLYFEVQKDYEVMATVRNESASSMLDPPRVTHLVDSIVVSRDAVHKFNSHRAQQAEDDSFLSHDDNNDLWMQGSLSECPLGSYTSEYYDEEGKVDYQLDLNTPKITAQLMMRVLDAMKSLSSRVDGSGVPSFWMRKYGLDEDAKSKFGVYIDKNTFSPSDIFTLKFQSTQQEGDAASSANCIPAHAVQKLLSALVIDLPPHSIYQGKPIGQMKVSVQQYFMLVDLHKSTDVVISQLKSRFSDPYQDSVESTTLLPLLDLVRIGVCRAKKSKDMTVKSASSSSSAGCLETGLEFSYARWPLASAMMQMTEQQKVSNNVNEDEKKGEGEDAGVSEEIQVNKLLLESIGTLLNTRKQTELMTNMEKQQEIDKDAFKEALAIVHSSVKSVLQQHGYDLDDVVDEEEEEDSECEKEEDVEPFYWSMAKTEIVVTALLNLLPLFISANILSDVANMLVNWYEQDQMLKMMDPQYETAEELHDNEEEIMGAHESIRLKVAMLIANRVIEVSPFHSQAYVARAKIYSQLGSGEIEEFMFMQQEMEEMQLMQSLNGLHGEAKEEETATNFECKHLKLAAKDALAAFHLGGSNDLVLAGIAEDACRQASRVDAKQIYLEKRALMKAGSSSSNSNNNESAELRLPKRWLIQAYLCAYEPIDLALGVHMFDKGSASNLLGADMCGLDYLEYTDVPMQVMRNDLDYADSQGKEGQLLDKIDEDSDVLLAQDKYTRELPNPPRALLEESPDEGVPACKPQDRQAFRLLRHLVTLLKVASSEKAPRSNRTNTNEGDMNDDMTYSAYTRDLLLSRNKELLEEKERAALTVAVQVEEVSSRQELDDIVAQVAIPNTFLEQGSYNIKHSSPMEFINDDSNYSAEADLDLKAAKRDTSELESASFNALFRLLSSPAVKGYTGVVFDQENGFVAVAESVDENGVMEGGMLEISSPLRARLLNICGVTAYLMGDAKGSVHCLKASLSLCPLHDKMMSSVDAHEAYVSKGLLDSAVKLGALLCDMDQRQQAALILNDAREVAEEHAEQQVYDSTLIMCLKHLPTVVIDLHIAELAIHEMDFDKAAQTLHGARRVLYRMKRDFEHEQEEIYTAHATRILRSDKEDDGNNAEDSFYAEDGENSDLPPLASLKTAKETLRQMEINIVSLLGVVMFRRNPEDPESALRMLKGACEDIPGSIYLLLCLGEVLGQVGDLVGSLSCFRMANDLDSTHPLPYVNAARTYLQLNQKTLSKEHVNQALLLDPNFALTYVDKAQSVLQEGDTQEALSTLDKALSLSRHVSDIGDVLTARRVAEIQEVLQEEGLYHPPQMN